MPFPVIPAVLIGGAALAAWRASKKKGMTPKRKQIFEAALRTLRDPVKLRKLADEFEKEGLKAEATVLRKRADAFAAPPAVQEKRKQIFKQAMSSTKPQAVKKVAGAMQKAGLYESASKLRNYAKGLISFKASSKVTSPKMNGDEFGDEEKFEGEDVPQSTAEV